MLFGVIRLQKLKLNSEQRKNSSPRHVANGGLPFQSHKSIFNIKKSFCVVIKNLLFFFFS